MKIGNIQINTWFIGSLSPKNTGVDAILWVSSRQKYPIPYMLVGLDSNFLGSRYVVVTVGNQPRVIASNHEAIIPPDLWLQIVKWINLNLKGLLMLWNDEICTADFCLDYLQKIE